MREFYLSRKSLILFLVSMLLLCVVLISIPRISMPLLVAFVFSMILRPLIPLLKKIGVGKNLSIVFILLGLGIFFLYPIVRFGPVLSGEIERFQYYFPKIERVVKEKYYDFEEKLKEKLGIDLPEEVDNIILGPGSRIGDLKGIIFKVPNVVTSILEWAFLLPLFLFFLLRDGAQIKRGFLKIVPNTLFEKTHYFVSQFNKQIGGYILAKFIEATIIGTIITVGFLLMDVRFALTLGFVGMVTNIIPYLGPILGMIPGVIVGFVDYGISPPLWGIVILYTVANVIDLAFIFPILVSKIVNLHPVVVIVSVIIGSQYLGVLGMIVSIPCAASLKLLLEEIYRDNFHPR